MSKHVHKKDYHALTRAELIMGLAVQMLRRAGDDLQQLTKNEERETVLRRVRQIVFEADALHQRVNREKDKAAVDVDLDLEGLP